MSDEMTIGNGVDLTVKLTAGDRKIFDMIDETIEQSIALGDVQPAMAMGRALRRGIQANGLALAKLLYKVSEAWEVFQYEDDLYEVIYTELGVAHSTAYKYINMWSAIFANPDIPDDVKQELEGKPIKALNLLTAAAREGEISEEDWERVADATTSSEVRGIVRDIRGERTSSRTAIVMEVNLTTGAIYARRGDDVQVVGMLLMSQRENSDLIDAAINKIVTNCNMMEK
ncbi:hypothetical protein IH575_00305 [Candidatus Dojkabacteria bacterium]|nr:hypothetical protein [Candidatus Dojkabacteria bacterium]